MDNTFKVLGIDPSSNYIGIALLEIDITSLEIVNIETFTIDLTLYVNGNYLLDNLTFRLNIFGKIFKGILLKHNPAFLASESGFINRLRPGAVIPLASAIMIMRTILYDIDPVNALHTYPPTVVKNAVGAKGNADKDGVLLALNKLTNITSKCDVNTISEHEVDAIAVAMCKLKEIINNEILLIIN